MVSLCVWAVDTRDLEDDQAQLIALEDLFEWTVRGLHNAVDPVSGIPVGLADLELTDAVWTAPPVEGAFGRELVCYFLHHEPIFDKPIDVTTPQPGIARGHVQGGPLAPGPQGQEPETP